MADYLCVLRICEESGLCPHVKNHPLGGWMFFYFLFPQSRHLSKADRSVSFFAETHSRGKSFSLSGTFPFLLCFEYFSSVETFFPLFFYKYKSELYKFSYNSAFKNSIRSVSVILFEFFLENVKNFFPFAFFTRFSFQKQVFFSERELRFCFVFFPVLFCFLYKDNSYQTYHVLCHSSFLPRPL